MTSELIRLLPTLGRRKKRAILMAHDAVAMVMALWIAFSVRLGYFYVPVGRRVLAAVAVAACVGLVVLYRFGVYRLVLRYFDMRAATRLIWAAGLSALAWVIAVYFAHAQISYNHRIYLVPRSIAVIYWGFLFVFLFMGRYIMARLLTGPGEQAAEAVERQTVVIYGANIAAIRLAESVRASRKYQLVAFVDSDPAVTGQLVAGVPILSPNDLPEIAEAHDLSEVFLAMPKATRSERLAAIEQVRELGLEVKTIPAPEEIASGRFTVSDIRPIDVSDLLRRDPVEPLGELIHDAVSSHCILITGAGGSIGSEICRQVLRDGPSRLVLLDHSEFALYTIHQHLLELRESLPQANRPQLVPVVGSMLNERLVRKLIAAHNVDTLYHAAAYKHVPLLEDNELVGIENNVFGTLAVVRAAFDAKITRFTMVSTDKAVRPKSIMGASKRVAELVVQTYAAQPRCRTRFGIVRFGNVLDSSGSVVQRFRQQIRAGGPVTVTHRDITRFFMSIPEATQLVLQASAMASEGEVFVLDMGEPVKITDLARHMIGLSGMTVRDDDNPDGDVEISFVGLRPGEKLYEELFVGDDTLGTIHPRIRKAKERVVPKKELDELLAQLSQALDKGDRGDVRLHLHNCIAAETDELVICLETVEARASAGEV